MPHGDGTGPAQPEPQGISPAAKKAVVDESKCSGCALCIRACPAGAISLREMRSGA